MISYATFQVHIPQYNFTQQCISNYPKVIFVSDTCFFKAKYIVKIRYFSLDDWDRFRSFL
jgi:hypothetical protein